MNSNEQFKSICTEASRAFRPWHKAEAEHLSLAYQEQRLPHALIFVGPQYVEKTHFAREFAQFLLCTSPVDGVACSKCKSCQLCMAGSHPDWLNIEPEEPRKVLRVDTIRQVQARLQQTAQQGGNKVCVISPAEQMNENAANALLKILEEPPANTYFLLVAHHASEILPTIISRCQRLSFAIPPRQEIINWLSDDFANDKIQQALEKGRGFPGRVYELLNGGIDAQSDESLLASFFAGQETAQSVAKNIDSAQLPDFLDSFLRLISHSLKSGQDGTVAAANNSVLSQLSACELHQIYDCVAAAKVALAQNANPRLLLESLLLQCFAIYSKFNS
ncbi:DNA polymerase III subunit delta' [Pseudomonadales bacterium]|nr:DNA polymerase III subunit delta' [Pseudomonadales bacterium]